MHAAPSRQPPASPPMPGTRAAAASVPLLGGPLGQALWRGSELAHGHAPGLASGFAALDALLPGGGWPGRALSEILQPRAGVCELRLLGPALAAAQQAGGRSLLLINPPFTPHLPGLAAWGLNPRQIVWLAPAGATQVLWTLEQALKANAAGALLAWLPESTRPEQLRRLQACALGAQAPCFVFRAAAAATQSSAAPLRLLLQPRADWELELRILKRRGPALAAPLRLRAVPPALAPVLSSRLLQGGPLPTVVPQESRDVGAALARPARVEQRLGV